MSVKWKASLERRVGQGVERRESAEAERRGSRSGEVEVTESSSCSAMRRTRSSETAGAVRATEADTGAEERRKRRRGGGVRRAVEQEAAHTGDGEDMASAKLLLVWPVAAVGLRRALVAEEVGKSEILTGGTRNEN